MRWGRRWQRIWPTAARGRRCGRKPRAGRSLVYLVADEDDAEARLADLAFFLPERRAGDDPTLAAAVEHFPAEGSSPYAEMQPDRRTLMRRMALLFQLAPRPWTRGDRRVGELAVSAGDPPRLNSRAFASPSRQGATVDRDQLVTGLVRAGFQRVQVVEDPGTFAVRGAVIDLFPPVYRHPVRLELLGDEVESVRLFDATTQRTLRSLDGRGRAPGARDRGGAGG